MIIHSLTFYTIPLCGNLPFTVINSCTLVDRKIEVLHTYILICISLYIELVEAVSCFSQQVLATIQIKQRTILFLVEFLLIRTF